MRIKGPAVGRTLVFGEPGSFVVLCFAVLGSVIALTSSGVMAGEWPGPGWTTLGWWVVLGTVANMLPAPAGPNIQLTMALPVNIAIAYLFPPSMAAAVVFLAATTEWDLKRETTLLRSLFNRAQQGLAAGAASLIFYSGPANPVWLIVPAVAAYEVCNVFFVSAAERTARGTSMISVIRRIRSPWLTVGVSYVALGILGYVLAVTYQRVGAWAVVVLMIPLVMARNALKVSKRLEQVEHDRRVLSERLIDERERERVRIASEIHDVVLQELAAVELQTDNVVSATAKGDLSLARRIAGSTGEAVRRAVFDLRQIVANMRRVSLDEGGLVPTLESRALALHAETGIELQVSADGLRSEIPLPIALLIYECCQEALTNVVRHSRASKASIGLRRSAGGIEVSIKDNGVGFPSAQPSEGLGLALIRDKVSLAGGSVGVRSFEGEGTEVSITLPMTEP
jgi:signal transduction histidine kinase